MTLKRLFSLLTAIMLCLLQMLPVYAEAADVVVRSAPMTRADTVLDGMVRVYLSSLGTPASLDITVVGSYSVDGAAALSLSDGDRVKISFDSATGQITMTVNGSAYAMGTEMALRRRQTSGESALKIAQANRPNNLYPGDLQLVSRASGSTYRLYPIVHVYMEYYLYGVVPYEMSSSWPAEALKAQAVAARTYTLRQMNARETSLYDVVDTTSDQVYNGYAGTQTNATRAVDATKGIVIMNDGQLSGTYYTASNGGQTEAVANAWGSRAYPYLGVKDDPFDLANPNTNKRKLTVYGRFNDAAQSSQLKSLLTEKARSQYGSDVSITAITSVTPHTPKYDAPSRLYTKLDFGVTLSTGLQAALTFSIFDELESALSMSLNSSKNELWSVAQDGSDFVITVARYGHGIGMSQRGAQQMSNMGYTYDQILGFYYEGCQRVQYTFSHTILPPIGSGDGPVVNTEAPATISPDSGAAARVQLAGVNDTLPIRYTPDENGRVLTAAANGSAVTVLKCSGNWTMIRYGEINGYVPTEHLTFSGTPPTETTEAATNVVQWGQVAGSTSLNLRSGASYTSSVIGSIPGGGVVPILSMSGSWAYVQYGQQTGYCAVSYLTLHDAYPQSSTGGDSAMVSLASGMGSAPLRSNADTSGAVLLYVAHGTQVKVLSNDGTWCRVMVSGVTGYMLASALDFTAVGVTPSEPTLAPGERYAIVASEASTLNLRSGPSTSHTILTEIPRGTQIVITSYGSEWCAVRWGSLTGYVMTMYLFFEEDEPTAAPETTYVPSGTPALLVQDSELYASASTAADSQVLLPSGITVTVVAYGDVWSKITCVGLTGYVLTENLMLYQDMETATPTASAPTATPTPNASPSPTPVPSFEPVDLSATVVLNALMREEADTGSQLLATIPAGTEVAVTMLGSSWCQVVYGDLTGWVLTTQLYLHEAEETPTAEPTANPSGEESISEQPEQSEGMIAWIVPTVTSVNLRAGAAESADVLAEIPANESLTVHETGEIWSSVNWRGNTGWVYTKYLTYAEPARTLGIRYVNTVSDPLALRDAPSTAGKLLTRMERGSTVTLLKAEGDWCYVQYGQLTGYCAASYLSESKPSQQAKDETRLLDYTLQDVTGWEAIVAPADAGTVFAREWCSLEAPEIIELKKDDRVTVMQKGDIWCLIRVEGKDGYCLTSQLQLIAPQD